MVFKKYKDFRFGFIKEIMKEWGVETLSRNDFEYLIRKSPGYYKSHLLKNFKRESNFKSFNKNQLNQFFSILEENKEELDRIDKSLFSKIKLFIKVIKDTIFNKINFDNDFNYKPKKVQNFTIIG